MKTKRKGTLLIIVGALLLVTVIGIAYAYFVAPLTRTNQTTSVTTGTLRLTFNDVSSSISKTMNFGESVTREFTIENTGSIDAYAKLNFKNLVNSYMLGSLKYTLTYSETGNAGTYKTKLTGMNVPVSASSANYEITDSLLIPANTIYHYQITVTLIDSDVIDQTADLNASFYTEFTIENGTELNSASEKTLAALNLTKSSGIPDFDNVSPSGNGEGTTTEKCYYGSNNVESQINTSEACQTVYEFIDQNGKKWYMDATVDAMLASMNGTMEKLGSANWDGTICKFGNNSMPLIYPITSAMLNDDEPQIVAAPETACNDVYKISIGGNDIIGTGMRVVQGEWISLTQESGIYSAEDDYGTSYYFRGNITNNYVKFGKYKNDYKVYQGTAISNGKNLNYPSLELCERLSRAGTCSVNTTYSNLAGSDMYWRIARINGDGSLRLIYDGTSAHANNDNSSDRCALNALNGVPWNDNNSDDAKYVGYMYGGANGEASTSKAQAQTNETSSHIKTVLDEWYKTTFAQTIYSTYLSDEIFCNDRSTASEAGEWVNNDTALGYGQNYTYFGPDYRQYYTVGRQPSLKCPQQNDAFTVGQNSNLNDDDIGYGNGDLTYPIGLITADELNIGGLAGGQNTNNYLYKNTWYWSLSPSDFYSGATVFDVDNGTFSFPNVNVVSAAVPVINLSADAARTLVATTVDGKRIYSLP